MTISVFDLFSVGIGPSSSHTIGPMRAATRFVDDLRVLTAIDDVTCVSVDLYGSLAATGAGHGTLSAVLLGLEGCRPEDIDADDMESRLQAMRSNGRVRLGGEFSIALAEDEISLHPQINLSFHPNGMRLTAFTGDYAEVHQQTYYSIGGGFVVTEAESIQSPAARTRGAVSFGSAEELLALAGTLGASVGGVMLEHERALTSTTRISTA